MLIDNLPLDSCIPIRIGDGNSTSGSRIGGVPPEGIASELGNQSLYLLTLQIEEQPIQELSIFLAPHWDDFAFAMRGKIHSNENKLLETTVHGETIRDPFSQAEQILTPHPMLLKSVTSDVMPTNTVFNRKTGRYEEVTERAPSNLVFDKLTMRFVDVLAMDLPEDSVYEPEKIVPYSGNKLGGRPFLIKAYSDLVESIIKIEDQGFRQLFQLDFPSFEDGNIDGNWPFGDGVFNLYWRYDDGSYQWRYFWQG